MLHGSTLLTAVRPSLASPVTGGPRPSLPALRAFGGRLGNGQRPRTRRGAFSSWLPSLGRCGGAISVFAF